MNDLYPIRSPKTPDDNGWKLWLALLIVVAVIVWCVYGCSVPRKSNLDVWLKELNKTPPLSQKIIDSMNNIGQPLQVLKVYKDSSGN